MTVKDLWEDFGNVPLDPETECIEAMKNGTHCENEWYIVHVY